MSSMATHIAAETEASTLQADSEDAESVFSKSILISAVRCVLTYVIFPFVAPLIGLAGVGPWVGIALSLVAIYFNVYSIHRFWSTDHRFKKPMSALNVGVIILVTVLLVLDVQQVL